MFFETYSNFSCRSLHSSIPIAWYRAPGAYPSNVHEAHLAFDMIYPGAPGSSSCVFLPSCALQATSAMGHTHHLHSSTPTGLLFHARPRSSYPVPSDAPETINKHAPTERSLCLNNTLSLSLFLSPSLRRLFSTVKMSRCARGLEKHFLLDVSLNTLCIRAPLVAFCFLSLSSIHSTIP